MTLRRWFGPVLTVLLFLPAGFSQQPTESREGYIEKIFEAEIAELPRMGWFTAGRGFLTEQNTAAEVYLFAPLGMPSIVQRNGYLTGNEVAALRKQYGIACGIAATGRLTVFYAGVETGAERALYTTRKMRGQTRAGLVTIVLDGPRMAEVNRVLGWPNQAVLRRDEAIGVRLQTFFYSLHRLYDAKSGALREEAIVLHRKVGDIIGHKLTRGLGLGQICDGCGIPNYAQADSGIYRPLNMFELPGFAYPVLLLDTSTHENEGLSLLTFMPDGKATQYRVSEYVMHCR